MDDDSSSSPAPLKAPPSKRAKTTDEDDASAPMSVDDNDDNNQDTTNNNNNNNKTPYYHVLPGFGEHKRAVSSVKFAPTRLTKTSALCASAAADGVMKLWDLQDASCPPTPAEGAPVGGGGLEPKIVLYRTFARD